MHKDSHAGQCWQPGPLCWVPYRTRECSFVLLEQTLGVPQGTQRSRLLCIHLLFVMQEMMVFMMVQVQHPLLLLVNETIENRCQMVQVCGQLMSVRSHWRIHW